MGTNLHRQPFKGGPVSSSRPAFETVNLCEKFDVEYMFVIKWMCVLKMAYRMDSTYCTTYRTVDFMVVILWGDITAFCDNDSA